MLKNIEVKAWSYHRNGVAGMPFQVVIFTFEEDEERSEDMLGIVFYPNERDKYANGYTAVLQISKLDDLEHNAWRGDNFEPELILAIDKFKREQGRIKDVEEDYPKLDEARLYAYIGLQESEQRLLAFEYATMEIRQSRDNEVQNALNVIRAKLYQENHRFISNFVMWFSVMTDQEELRAMAKALVRKAILDKMYSIMRYMNPFLANPGHWWASEENEFREEIDDFLNNH